MGYGPLPFDPTTNTLPITGSTLTLTSTGNHVSLVNGANDATIVLGSSGQLVFDQLDALDVRFNYQGTTYLRAFQNALTYTGAAVSFFTDTSGDYTAGFGRFRVSGIAGFSDCGISCGGAANRVGITANGTDRVTITETLATFAVIPILPTYAVGALPTASSFARGLIYVSDGTGNKRLAISDGTNWRFPDGDVVS